jgi:hypothetical protein
VIISYVIMLFLPQLPASIQMWAVVSGMTVSIEVGLVFGVWLAKKAANLDPIECLIRIGGYSDRDFHIRHCQERRHTCPDDRRATAVIPDP